MDSYSERETGTDLASNLHLTLSQKHNESKATDEIWQSFIYLLIFAVLGTEPETT